VTDVANVANEPRVIGGVAETRTGETNRERISRRQVDKFAERRAQLAGAALQTLAELGYARTSLREIAQNSQFSHGVLHYYFSDKQDLLTHCVRQYEAACVTRYDEIVATAGSAEELEREFSAAMAQTLRTDAPMHRLWYDLRNQSLFEEAFRADAHAIDQSLQAMIWRIATRFAELSGTEVGVTPPVAYAVMDGVFQNALIAYLGGDESAPDALEATVRQLMRCFLGGKDQSPRPPDVGGTPSPFTP
jgi:AcrR family transcriptional regulator